MRGLKFGVLIAISVIAMSHPTMGAWIEIFITPEFIYKDLESHPTMGAWIEII